MTTDAALATSMVSLNLSIKRMNEIAERSKSTDATLARIARMQASWAPAEQVMQEGMDRYEDSFARQIEETRQALARISGVKAFTPMSSTASHHDMKPETRTMEDARKVFDAWSTQQEVTMSNIIHVSVSHMIYPVTEDVLRQVFQMNGYGVTKMTLFQGSSCAEASVQLRSGHEAVRARDALHGRNIYDSCCNISIKCTPVTTLSTAAALSLAMEPNTTLTTSNTVAAPMLFATAMGTPAAAQSNLSMGSASTCDKKVVTEMPVSPMPRSDVEVFQPTTVPTSEASRVQSPMATSLAMKTITTAPVIIDTAVASPPCHDKGRQHCVLEVTPNQRNPRHVIKWVPRVRSTRRWVRWTPKRNYSHSLPSLPPRPPDQPCSGKVPAPKSLLRPSCRFVTSLGCNSELMPPEKKAWCENAFSPGNKELHMVHFCNDAKQSKVLMPKKYKGLDCKWNLELLTVICWESWSSSVHDAWPKLWAPTQCVVWPLIYFATERQGLMIKEGVNLSAASRKHSLQQLSCYSVLSFVGNSNFTIVNDTQCFAAYPECSLDLGDHEMCLFLAIRDATILCQEFLHLHTSIASLLSKIRELENNQLTVRQWDPGPVQLIAMGASSWDGSARLRFSTCLKIRYGGWQIGGQTCSLHRLLGQNLSLTEDKQMRMICSISAQTATSVRANDELVYRIQQEARSRCYFCMQSRLFGFSTHQQCNMAVHDGIPWDPGGFPGRRIQSIAWGQAMFCRGGSVTLYIPWTILVAWAVYMGSGRQIKPWSWTDKDTREVQHEGGKKQNQLGLLLPQLVSSRSPSPPSLGLVVLHKQPQYLSRIETHVLAIIPAATGHDTSSYSSLGASDPLRTERRRVPSRDIAVLTVASC